MVGIIGDRAGQLGESGEYSMRMKGSGLIWNSELQGGSSRICQLRPMSVEPGWTSIWTILTHTGYMESPNWVVLCVTKMEAILPYLTGVHRDSAWATHGGSIEAYAWKTSTRVRWATSWIVATRGTLLTCVCRVVRFIPLQGWLLIQISMTPSDMGDSLFAVFKRIIINFIILCW
jgi:hypothetical protein